MKKKYIVYPGDMISKRDNSWHYITAGQLMTLYKVSPAECIIYHDESSLRGIDKSDMIELYPNYSGNYNLTIRGNE